LNLVAAKFKELKVMSVITGLLLKDEIHELTSHRVSNEAKMRIVLVFRSYFKLKIIYLIKF